jgi:hypothetical protein
LSSESPQTSRYKHSGLELSIAVVPLPQYHFVDIGNAEDPGAGCLQRDAQAAC